MQVSSYQMQNVLECFGRRLSRMRKNEKPAEGLPKKIADEQALSAESSRQATMEKISRQVLDKGTDGVALSLSQPTPVGTRLKLQPVRYSSPP